MTDWTTNTAEEPSWALNCMSFLGVLDETVNCVFRRAMMAVLLCEDLKIEPLGTAA